MTMYKLMRGKTCLFLGPLKDCHDQLKKEVGNATMGELLKNQWSILPARPGALQSALAGL